MAWMESGAGRGRWAAGLGVVVVLAVGLGAVGLWSGDEGVGGPALEEASVAPGSLIDAAALGADRLAAAAGGDEEAADASEAGEDPTSGAWASPMARSPVRAVPASQRVPKPAAVRGIYAGSRTVGSATGFERLIRLADATEVNAFVIDVKDVTGEVTYASQVPLARQVGATDRVRIADIRGRLERLREHGVYPIARIVVFMDPLLATARPEWAIVREDGSVWADKHGVHWVDSFNRNVWDYNIELAREAIALGFSEIQWDYVRFPDAPASYLAEAVHPARDGRTKTDGIREFMIYARDRLGGLDVPLTADVFGITTSTHADIGIGQVWEKLADVTDVLLPMVYPSHYPKGSWNYPRPNAAPYQIVKKAMDDGVRRSRTIDNAAAIRPWLQAFNLGQPDYGPREIRAQIDAVYDAGLTEWVLWSPNVRYPVEAFASATGEEPWFAGMGASLYTPGSAAPPERTRDTAPRPLGEPVGSGPQGR